MTATNQPDRSPAPGISPAGQARLEVDRLADEGGSLAAEGSRRIGAQMAPL